MHEIRFPNPGLAHQNQVVLALNKRAGGQFFDLDAIDGGLVEVPVELAERLAFNEVGLADAMGDRAFAALVGLLGDEQMQELLVRQSFARARARMASNAAAASGTLRAAKSARMRSRRSVGIVVGFVGGGVGGRGVLRRAMSGRFLHEVAVFSSGSRDHRVVAQMVGQMPALAIGEGIQNTLRRGSGREDAFDGVERIGAEANGPFQGGEQIGAGIGALQGQDLERLLVAVALVADQAVEEAPASGPSSAKRSRKRACCARGSATGRCDFCSERWPV